MCEPELQKYLKSRSALACKRALEARSARTVRRCPVVVIVFHARK